MNTTEAIKKVVNGYPDGCEFTAYKLFVDVSYEFHIHGEEFYTMDATVTRKFRDVRTELECVFIGEQKYKKVIGLRLVQDFGDWKCVVCPDDHTNGHVYCFQMCHYCKYHGKNWCCCRLKEGEERC